MFDLLEDPGVTDGRTANHNAINSVPVFVFNCFLGRVYITISENGNLYPRVFFYACNMRPVGRAFIKLAPGSAMNRKRLDAYILQTLRNFFYIDGIMVPSQPGFN